MTRRRTAPDFPPSTVYDWDAEPQDERPSEFAPTTGYRVHSGFYAAPVVARRRGGATWVWLAAGIVAGLAIVALLVLVRLLRH